MLGVENKKEDLGMVSIGMFLGIGNTIIEDDNRFNVVEAKKANAKPSTRRIQGKILSKCAPEDE